MQLDRMTIAGLTRFHEPVTLDLLEIPEGSLVAIVGDNGEGKTTLLDSVLAPLYLTMPSRRGTLPTYATSSSAWLEAVYRLDDGALARARVAVDGPRRQVKPILTIELPGGNAIATDGKVDPFRELVARHFPPLELALASAFAPQNRAGSFITATNAQRKELFGICLGLEQFAAWAATAKEALDLVAKTIAKLEGRRDVLAGLVAPAVLEELERNLDAARGREAYAVEAVELLRGSQTQQERRRVELAAELEAHVRATMAHEAAKEAARRAAAEGVALLTERDDRVREAGLARRRVESLAAAELKDNEAQRTAARQAARTKTEALELRIKSNQAVLGQADAIRDAVAKTKTAEAELTNLRSIEWETRQGLDDEAGLERAARIDLAGLAKLETLLEEARRQAGIIAAVPCQGRQILVDVELGSPAMSADGGACQFLTDAKAAAARIPELEGLVDARRPLLEAISRHEAEAARLRVALAEVRRNIETHEATIRLHSTQVRYEPALAAAEERMAGYRRELEGVAVTLADRINELDAREAGIRERADEKLVELERLTAEALAVLAERMVRLEAQQAEADDALRAAVAEVERTQGAAAAVDTVVEALKEIGDQIARRTGDLATAQAETRRLEGERADRRRKAQELERTETALDMAHQEAAVWELLARCFGRDGLPTLEIANAGPTVSSLTNELLEVAYGTRFTVEVVTQVARAGGKGLKEDFTIRIFDNQEGGVVRDIADLSGGERVLVEEALRAAIMVFVNARNVTPFRTICRDETTGALDPENAVRYVAMLRRLVALAGAAHCLFITHNPECAALADVILEVKDGRLERRTA